MARRGVQHWKKRKAIAAYLFRRRWWAITLEFKEILTLVDSVNITAPGQHNVEYSNDFGFTDTLDFATALEKAEVLNILETVSLSFERDLTPDSFVFSETLAANFDKVLEDATADNVSFSEQLDIIFSLAGLTDDILFTENYSNKLTKALADGFGIDDTIIADKEVLVNKQNILSFATDIHTWSFGKGLSETLTLNEVIGKTISRTFSDGFGIAETSISKVFTGIKSDGVIANHSETADVVISGTFANRKLGGEPFNKLTFN